MEIVKYDFNRSHSAFLLQNKINWRVIRDTWTIGYGITLDSLIHTHTFATNTPSNGSNGLVCFGKDN